MRRALVLLAFLVGLATLVASAGAKEGTQARIVTPISSKAAPGATLTVVWTLSFLDKDARRPFSADGVYIRLFDSSGAPSARAYAIQAQPGRYRARPKVPRGGVSRVVIGLMGTSCDATGCRPSPHVFRIVGPVLR